MELDPKDYLAPSEVARRLGVSGETVRSWARRGLVRAVQTPTGRWRIHKDALKIQPK